MLEAAFELNTTLGIAIISVLGVVLTAGVAMMAQLYSRVGKIEGDLLATRDYSHRLWAYCRGLLDLYYRHRKDGAPEPEPLPEMDG